MTFWRFSGVETRTLESGMISISTNLYTLNALPRHHLEVKQACPQYHRADGKRKGIYQQTIYLLMSFLFTSAFNESSYPCWVTARIVVSLLPSFFLIIFQTDSASSWHDRPPSSCFSLLGGIEALGGLWDSDDLEDLCDGGEDDDDFFPEPWSRFVDLDDEPGNHEGIVAGRGYHDVGEF